MVGSAAFFVVTRCSSSDSEEEEDDDESEDSTCFLFLFRFLAGAFPALAGAMIVQEEKSIEDAVARELGQVTLITFHGTMDSRIVGILGEKTFSNRGYVLTNG